MKRILAWTVLAVPSAFLVGLFIAIPETLLVVLAGAVVLVFGMAIAWAIDELTR